MTSEWGNDKISVERQVFCVSTPIEIERKFVIRMPSVADLEALSGYTVSEIDQTYLISSPHVTRRVRARKYAAHTAFTETKKTRLDKMSALEDERRISEAEYRELLLDIQPGTVTLHKRRYTFEYLDRVIEIDVYPEWERSCILEVELDSKDTEVKLPNFISVIAEVTGDKRYSNASMSHEFPKELI